jgi:hypothetical protein
MGGKYGSSSSSRSSSSKHGRRDFLRTRGTEQEQEQEQDERASEHVPARVVGAVFSPASRNSSAVKR